MKDYFPVHCFNVNFMGMESFMLIRRGEKPDKPITSSGIHYLLLQNLTDDHEY